MEDAAQELFNEPNSTSITVTTRWRAITTALPREAGMLATIRMNLTARAESREVLQSVQTLLRDESRFRSEIEPLRLKRTASGSTLVDQYVSIVSVGDILYAGSSPDDDDDDEKQRVSRGYAHVKAHTTYLPTYY
jgi:hypothetical protein